MVDLTGSRNDYLDAGDGNDTAYGDAGDDTLFGGAGDDTLYGGQGADSIDGGSGTDTIDFSASGDAVTVDLQTEEGRELAGIPANMVRLCVGAEHAEDTIEDLDQALALV